MSIDFQNGLIVGMQLANQVGGGGVLPPPDPEDPEDPEGTGYLKGVRMLGKMVVENITIVEVFMTQVT